MSVSGISSASQYQFAAAANLIQQQFKQLGKDLQSGNLSSSQSDFAKLQAAFSQPANTGASSSTSTSTSPVNQAFSQLASDLQSGNLSAAQKDFSAVQQDLKSQGPPSANHLHHHHRPGSEGGSGDSSGKNSLLQDLSQVGQSLTSNNLAGAQQAYATLQQQLQQFALSGGALTSESPVSFDA